MNKDLVVGLAWGGGMMLLALAAQGLRQLGYLDQDTVLRIVIGANGLMIAFYGNRAPKAVAPTAVAQQVARVSGWAFVISGLIYAGLWAFAPIPAAVTLGTAAMVGGMAVTLGYLLWRKRQADLSR
jgi:hypothetical protein